MWPGFRAKLRSWFGFTWFCCKGNLIFLYWHISRSVSYTCLYCIVHSPLLLYKIFWVILRSWPFRQIAWRDSPLYLCFLVAPSYLLVIFLARPTSRDSKVIFIWILMCQHCWTRIDPSLRKALDLGCIYYSICSVSKGLASSFLAS